MAVKKLEYANFQNEIGGSKGIVLVDFYSDWCGPCKMLSPIVDEISEERGDIVVGKVNIDENMEIAAAYNVMSIPTLVIMKNGKIVNQSRGARPKSQILSLLES